MPGVVFHLTARTQDGKPRFRPDIRPRIVEFIGEAVGQSDARLLAYAVMSNHLHVVVQQGEWELGEVMQPLLRRTALLVHSREGTRGHVFERPFRDRGCLDPYHARNAIVYAHLNPVRASITDHPADYHCSSHDLYAHPETANPRSPVDTATGLRLFVPDPEAASSERGRGYRRYVVWRLERDRRGADPDDVADLPTEPEEFRVAGPWGRVYAPLFPTRSPCDSSAAGRDRPKRDLRDIARQVFAESNAGQGLELDHVRSGRRRADLVRMRRLMVWQMAQAGHRVCDIARYMRVSDQCVSAILSRIRRTGEIPT